MGQRGAFGRGGKRGFYRREGRKGAMGCFNPEKSDLDLLLVVEHSMAKEDKVKFMEEVSQRFGPVSKDEYVDSIWNDIKDVQESIGKEPVYVILNLCRGLGYVKENLVLSKESGGCRGLKAVPERYHALIQKALSCYKNSILL
ncbi:MAG: DUF4111 domain-containing protein [Hungatella sp.]|nr:DUF4111 domain-containing protein [Hungatella sp.]